MAEAYHLPVMLQECINALDIKQDGTYVDVTFGGGGHSNEILKHITSGKLYAFDQDPDAVENAKAINHEGFVLIQANFRDLKRYLKFYKAGQVDGILADLGVSSHQFDVPERGFSTRFDAKLDMRMSQSGNKTAASVLNEYSEQQLHKLLGMYGEVKNARTLALAIVAERSREPIRTVGQLKSLLDRYAPKHREYKYYAQVFQALRMEVNEELKALEEMLQSAVEVLKPGGRLAVMSYHSLEDRMVKNLMLKGNIEGKIEKDFYGNMLAPLRAISRKPITASDEEIVINNRARSAKLRIAEKI